MNIKNIFLVSLGCVGWALVICLIFVFLSTLPSCKMLEDADKRYEKIQEYQSQMDISSIPSRKSLPKRLEVISQELKIDTVTGRQIDCLIVQDKNTKEQFIVVSSFNGLSIVPLSQGNGR